MVTKHVLQNQNDKSQASFRLSRVLYFAAGFNSPPAMRFWDHKEERL